MLPKQNLNKSSCGPSALRLNTTQSSHLEANRRRREEISGFLDESSILPVSSTKHHEENLVIIENQISFRPRQEQQSDYLAIDQRN